MAFSLQEALEQIRSDKIKERQQGLEALEHIFSDLDNVHNLESKQDGKAWLKVFQSLFACVLAEKAACIRKGSFSDAQPVALARLQRAAQVLRSLVQGAASLLTRKVVKALLRHILQMLNHRGTLLRPIAPAYISALCAILKHQHHVDHLDPEDWCTASSLCFDVLLGRDLEGTAAATNPQEWLVLIPAPPSASTNRRTLSLEDAVTAESLRHLMASTVAPLLGSHGYGVQLLADYTRFFLFFDVESSAHLPAMTAFVTLIEHLELNHTREVIYSTLALRRILFYLWDTKNRLLKIQLLLFLRIVSPLIASCATKQTEVGLSQDHPNFAALRIEAADFLELAYHTLLRDPETRWGLEPMRLDALVFHWPQQSQTGSSKSSSVLCNSAFHLGPYSAEQDTLAWCRLTLQVDLLEALVLMDHLSEENGTSPANHRVGAADEPAPSLATTSQPSSTPKNVSNAKRGIGPTASSPQKRRKMERTIRSVKFSWLGHLLNIITGTEQPSPPTSAARLCALQLLTFVVLTHPDFIGHDNLGDGVQKRLLQLPTNTDAHIISWSYVALGAIAMTYDTANTKITDSNFNWVKTPSGRFASSHAMQSLQLADTCRAAAFLQSILLVRGAIPEDGEVSALSRFLAEVDLQGPPILCDSVCHLMALVLLRTASDRKYQHLHPKRKIGAWFSNTYSPVDAFRSTSSTSNGRSAAMFLPYHDLLRLLDCIVTERRSGYPDTTCMSDIIYTDSIAEFMRRRAQLQPLRDLTLKSCISVAAEANNPVPKEAPEDTPPLLSAESYERMISVLDKKVMACAEALKGLVGELGSQPSASCQAAISALHVAMLTVEIRARSHPRSSMSRQPRIRSDCQVIMKLVDVAFTSKSMCVDECKLVIQQLGLLVPSGILSASGDAPFTSLLRIPGAASGIAANSGITPFQSHTAVSRSLAFDDSHKRFWVAIQDAEMAEAMMSCCERVLERALLGDQQLESQPASASGANSRDAFDDMPESGSSSQRRAWSTEAQSCMQSTQHIVSVVLRLLGEVPRIVSGNADSQRDERIVSLFFDCPVEAIISLAPVLLESRSTGTLWISQRDLVDALDRIGSELLTSYNFAKLPAARIAAVNAVAYAVPLLLEELDEQSDLFDKVQKLAIFFADQIGRTKWPAPWQVQVACAEFLATCLRLDPEGRMCQSGSARGPAFSPLNALLQVNADADIRVRALGSSIASTAFDSVSSDEAHIAGIYSTFRDGLPSDSSIPQKILTRALSLCNVAIANSSVRRSSLFHLLEIVLATGMLPVTVQQLFAQVAVRLGFADAPSCYQAFAAQITWGMATNAYDPLQLPWKVLGFSSKRECLEATFAACGSMLLALQTPEGRTQFDTLVHLTRRTSQQALQECLPFLTAAYLGFAVEAGQRDGPTDLPTICQQALHELSMLGFAESDNHSELRQMITNADDLIVTTLLSLYHEPGVDIAGSRWSAVQALTQQGAALGEALSALTPATNGSAASLHEPSRPFFPSAVVCTALSALPGLGIEPFRKDVIYNVLRHLFYQIASSRFVNDQLRLCAALRIYLAMCGDAFWTDQLNAHLLIRSIDQLLDQPHLRDDFRPILVHACNHSQVAEQSSEALVSCILTWSNALAVELDQKADIGDWLFDAARAVAKSSSVATSAIVLLWPVQVTTTELVSVEGLIDVDTLSFALDACPRTALQMASLHRIRAVLRKTNKSHLHAFCRQSAWKLLQRMADCRTADQDRASGEAQSDVISDIFTIVMSSGEVASFERSGRRGMGNGHQIPCDMFLNTVDTSQISGLYAAAILAIHQLGHSFILEQNYQAFETLRNIAAASQGSLVAAHSTKVPAQTRQELDRIRPGISPLVPSGAPPQADDLLEPDLRDTAASPNRWVCNIASLLCDVLFAARRQPIFRPIASFVSNDAEAARALLPILLLCFTSTDIELETPSPPTRSSAKRRTSGKHSQPPTQETIRESFRAAVAKHFEQVLKTSTSNPACSEIIVESLLAVRSFRPMHEEPDKVCYWYNVDTNLLAQRCIACGMFSAAIFFVEHGSSHQGGSPASGEPAVRTGTNLLHEAYMNIDDPDAFYGITDGDVRELLLKRLHHEGQWLRAFQYHAADFEASSSDGVRRLGSEGRSLRQSLSSLGFNRLFDSVGPRSEAGLSLAVIPSSYYGINGASWDLPGAVPAATSKDHNLDTVLQALRQLGSENDADRALSITIPSQLQALCSTPIESISAMRAIEGELLALSQVKEWRKASASLGADEAVAHLRATWTSVNSDHHFDVTEKVLNTRRSVLQAARQRLSRMQIGDALDGPAAEAGKVERSLLVLLSRQAREHENLQKAINATARAERIEKAIDDGANVAREEFAAVLWEQKEHSPAMQLLSQIVDDLSVKASSPAPQKRRGARLLALLAQWRATARSQHPREIDRALFEPALRLIASSNTPETATSLRDPAAAGEQCEIAYRWARFAEEHHRGSDLAEITRLRLYIDRRLEEIAQNQRECERTTSKTERGKLLQFQRQAEKMLRQDQTRLTELEASRTHFLHRSVAMYARALASADAHDDAVARLISLWFENAADAGLNRLLTTSLSSIASRKFVALMHQLSARLTEVSDSSDSMAPFQTNLAQLLLRMCQEHPFHCLYAVFALIKTGADAKASTQGPSPRNSLGPSESSSLSPSPQILRSTAAEKIWNHIKRRPALSKRIKAFEELCLAYVEWAEYDLTSRPDRYFQSSGSVKKGALRMPPSGELRLARMRSVDVPVATARLEIDPTCRYESFVSITRYSDTFTTAGGIHLPKISECIGSDGKRYKQLFKRDDDLRQDAVMQQVFRVVNELLHADRKTRERRLTIRTYAVLPLGPQCGMLEFVSNTVPLGEVLLALHEKYRGNDLTPLQARAKIRDAQSLPAETKLEAFLDVCERMRPALHYFFSEASRMPRDWYETRLRYTRSVSTNSIVGHTLGLGDRHVSNILLDKESGELVHIDFGVAFDQGKLLPIPELVPFRLTRDIVDGMGVNGVEGTFRRCCEETLRMLRAHRDVIKTVLEVFRHDPLFAWTSNPIKVLQRQAEEESSLPAASIERSGVVASAGGRSTPAPTPTAMLTAARGSSWRSTTPYGMHGEVAGGIGTDTAELSADRAITSVMAKLSSSLSIEYTVNDLIQQAMDAGNLSAIFHGWQAAL